MGRTLIEILPLAVAAAVSPAGLLAVMAILSGKGNARRNSLFFLLGSMLLLVATGLIVILFFHRAVHASSHSKEISAWIDIALGCLIIMIVAFQVLYKGGKEEKKEEPHPHKRPYFVIGFLYMMVNTSTLIPFIAACKIIGADRLALAYNITLLAFVVAVTTSLIAIPVILSYAAPNRSEAILGPVKSFMNKHGGRIAQVFFLLIAVYLLLRGFRGLRL
jgi:hypothetical protein